jgi:HTH-type transcriptional regulator/antitoxin HigA
MATKARKFKLERYVKLVSRFPLIPIESDAQLDRAIALINELLDRDRNVEEDLYLDVLGTLVEQYENETYPEEPVADAEILAHLLEARGMTQARLAKKAGIAESTISEVLKGSRKLTRSQIGRVSAAFNIPANVFDFSS